MRKLVSIRTIDEVHPITFLNEQGELEEASAIEKIVIGGWNVVARKGAHNVGELCVYGEIDTIFPADKPIFAFLEGKRLKTKKLKKVLSQGIVFTIPELYDDCPLFVRAINEGIEFGEGDDITQLVEATKYDEYTQTGKGDGVKLPPSNARGSFPNFIPKTDEERIQNRAKELKYEWGAKTVVEREKLHGSSITIYCRNAPSTIEGLPDSLHYGICSRNLDLKLEGDSPFILRGLPVLIKLVELCGHTKESFAIQGELIGPGINGNPYRLETHDIKFFTAYDIENKKRLNDENLSLLIGDILGEDLCPFMGCYELNPNMDLILAKVEGMSALNPKVRREGSVFRAVDGTFSFKAVSNDWLLHEK